MAKRNSEPIDERKPLSARQAGQPPSHFDREAYEARIAEALERDAADTRTELQRLLGEPPPSLSALAKAKPPKPDYEPTRDDARYAGLIALMVSDQLARIATVRRTRVRLPRKRDD